MNGTTSVVMGDRGQIELPSAVRSRRNWSAGTTLVLIETADGLLLTELQTALNRLRAAVGTAPLVDELIAERRREAADEDE